MLAGIDVAEIRSNQAIPDARRESAAWVVDLAFSFYDKRHQRCSLARLELEREYVTDVGRIEPRPFVGKRVAVHVAHRSQYADRLRAEYVRRWAVTGWAGHWVRYLASVLHNSDEGVRQIDLAVA